MVEFRAVFPKLSQSGSGIWAKTIAIKQALIAFMDVLNSVLLLSDVSHQTLPIQHADKALIGETTANEETRCLI